MGENQFMGRLYMGGNRLIVSILMVIGAVWAGLFSGRPAAALPLVTRDLLELGSIAVPSRLEPRLPDETPERVLFRFDRVEDSFFFMGSTTPVRELLVVAAWPDNDRSALAAWEGEFRWRVIEHVEGISWTWEGEFEVGRGIHRVNTRETPAWALMLHVPEQRLKLGYRLWQKDGSLDEAKALLKRIAASYAPARTPEDFFAMVRARPGQLAAERRSALLAELAGHGVTLPTNGTAVEHDGTVYHFSPSWTGIDGAWLFVMTPLGTLPAGTPFGYPEHRQLPRGVSHWPDLVYFHWKEQRWQMRGMGQDYFLPPAVAPWLDARHTDTSRVYVYAVKGMAVDETPPDETGLPAYWKAVSVMPPLLAPGNLSSD
jgi:hypothetical protein